MNYWLVSASLVAGLLVSDVSEAKKLTQYKTYIVKKGDTLSQISKRYKVTVGALRELNALTAKRFIRPGQRLKVRKYKSARLRGALGYKKAKRRTLAKLRRMKMLPGRQWTTYTVKRGDSLWGIADRFDVPVKHIIQANNLGKRPRLFPGNKLRVQRKKVQISSVNTRLPRKGLGYKAMRPTKSWGTKGTVALIEHVYAQFHELHPNSTPGLIADLSKKGGGTLRPHKSHHRGIDVDVSYYKKDNQRMRGLQVVTPESIDLVKTWDVLRLYLNTGHIKVIFMDYRLQKALHGHLVDAGYDEELLRDILQYPRARSKRRGIIRHSQGHHHHLHVRFNCLGNRECTPTQSPMVAERLHPAPSSEDMGSLFNEDSKLATDIDALTAMEIKKSSNEQAMLPVEPPKEQPTLVAISGGDAPKEPSETTPSKAVRINPLEPSLKPVAVKPALVVVPRAPETTVVRRRAEHTQRHHARKIELEAADWLAAFKVGPKPSLHFAGVSVRRNTPKRRQGANALRMVRFGPQPASSR